MIWGVLAKRRGSQSSVPVIVSRLAVSIVHAASRSFSNSDVSLGVMTAARRMSPQSGRADASLGVMTAARRSTPQTGAAAASMNVLTAARRMSEPKTPVAVSRMMISVVHT